MSIGLGDFKKDAPSLFPQNKIFKENASHFYCEVEKRTDWCERSSNHRGNGGVLGKYLGDQ